MAVFGLEIWQILLTALIACFIIKKFFLSQNNMPPHVPGIPFLGNINQVHALSISLDLTKLAEEYGEIFTINLLGKTLVAINSEELILDLYANSGEDFVNRHHASYAMQKSFYDGKGLTFRPWSVELQHLRRISIHAIMMVGEQKQQIQDLIQEEAEALVDILSGYDGKPVDPQDDIQASIINVMTVLMIGKHFPREDPDSDLLIELVNRTMQIATPGFGLELDMFPFLRHFPIQSSKILNRMIQIRDDFINKHYQQIKETFQGDSLRCLADHMIKEMHENPDANITDDVIKAVSLDMIVAGGFTSSATLLSIIVILANHQEVQKRLQEEIDQIIGRGMFPSIPHKTELHYVRAFILEVLRYLSVGTGASKAAYKDSTIKGYNIPKDTLVLLNLYCIHHDPRKWKDPYKVDPGRFLDEEGHLVPADHPNRKRLLSFGGGKRGCIGEVFAKDRVFIFMTVLLQRFSFVPAEGEPAPVDDPRKFVPSFVIKPPPFKVQIMRRE